MRVFQKQELLLLFTPMHCKCKFDFTKKNCQNAQILRDPLCDRFHERKLSNEIAYFHTVHITKLSYNCLVIMTILLLNPFQYYQTKSQHRQQLQSSGP